MSRIPQTGDRAIEMPPANNVYTVLLIVATLANVIGFIMILMRASAVFGPEFSLFK